ncbi:hypothetical protein J1605_018047 [Eschrichtius robustus]|uniref:Uncharacterized protein n=1 Tax=Eschrichtius robustus TaxID=9764 RepID=A0AB34HZT6_ESCRO|nr:hypothetical protein J1605_018047 [Eschrichtius robustus]
MEFFLSAPFGFTPGDADVAPNTCSGPSDTVLCDPQCCPAVAKCSWGSEERSVGGSRIKILFQKANLVMPQLSGIRL